MSIVGYAAASGRFLDIHPFLRGLAQGLDGDEGPEIELSKEMYAELDRVPDLEDPTEKVAEYYEAWWTWNRQWKTMPPVLVNRWIGLDFHRQKVSLFRMCLRVDLIRPDTQYGKIRPPYPLKAGAAPIPPRQTLSRNPCNSQVCKERLWAVMEENRKSSAVTRTLQLTLEEKRVAATRHTHNLKIVRKYQLDKGKNSLDATDCNNLLFEAGEDAVLEVPSDSELQFTGQKKKSAKATSAGPSVTTGPSTNRSRDLTPESLSSFDDSASEYRPSE